jgi:hypothetical protein
MKTTLLLATALFLVSAPSPDSETISEISAGFLAPSNDRGLMAAELAPDVPGSGIADKQRVQQANPLSRS